MIIRKFIVVLTILLFGTHCSAAVINFNNGGNRNSNEVLSNYIQDKYNIFSADVISYYFDIDNDSKKEIVGLVKHGAFYKLANYQLVVLKQNDWDMWNMLKSEVYFNPDENIEIENKNITYYQDCLGKNKKQKAKLKNDTIVKKINPFNIFAKMKMAKLERTLELSSGKEKNIIEIAQFNAQKQRSVNISYKNLSPRTKHYIDLK